jgi:predicted SnoaL-like aldol condensation-catalyzing enzyme
VGSDVPTEQDTKRLVLDFFDLAFVQRKAAEAAERYVGEVYIQHDPTARDGPELFVEFIGQFQAMAPDKTFDIKRVIADGDLVALHYHLKMTPEDLGRAVVDIFRVEGGRVVEHWDVLQDVPAEAANENTMF